MKTCFTFLLVVILLSTNSLCDTTCVKQSGTGDLPADRPVLANQIGTIHFIIHWESPTTQTYAQNAAAYAEYAYQQQCDSMNWRVPPPDDNRGGDNRYDIYLVDENYPDISGSRGITFYELTGNWTYEWAPSFILIINNLSDDELKMVVAHEFNHASQLAYTYQDLGNDTWFYENTAVWMAEMTYNYAYRYYERYLGADPLQYPEFGIIKFESIYGFYIYAGFLWPKFLAEWRDDNDIIRKIWQRMGNIPGENILNDINIILMSQYSSNLNEAVRYYAEWRYFTGDRDDGFHFNDAHLLPTSTVVVQHSGSSASGIYDLRGFGGTRFIEFNYFMELIEIGFNGDNAYSWQASVIEKKLNEASTNKKIELNSNQSGSIELVNLNIEKFILTPILNSLTYKKNFNYNAQWYDGREVFFYNKIGTNVVDGILRLDGTKDINSGDSEWLRLNSNHNIRTMNERYVNTEVYKHNNWNGIANQFYLNRDFTVQHPITNQSANFVQILASKIQVMLEGYSFQGLGNGSFQDPWYLFSDGTQPGNSWIDFTSEYEPTGKEGATEKGVFLNQGGVPPNLTPPYYSVKADQTQNVYLNNTGRTHPFRFRNWSTNGSNYAELENSNALETGVVFKLADAEVKANYKAPQLSNQTNAYDFNNQQKFVRTNNGNLHNFYFSLGALWYERSTDGGTTWNLVGGTPVNTNNPKQVSIAHLPQSTNPEIILVAFQHQTAAGSKVVIYVYKDGAPRPGTFKYDVISFEHTAYEYDEINAEPVISMTSAIDFLIVYKVTSILPLAGGGEQNAGLYYSIGRLNAAVGYPLTWYSMNQNVKIPTTGINSIHPAIASDVAGSLNRFHIAYEENSTIKYLYRYGQPHTGNLSPVNNPVNISARSGFSQNYHPSIIALGTNAGVCWVGYRLGYYEDEISPIYGLIPQYKVIYKNTGLPDNFWQFGKDVSSPNINKRNDNGYFALGWSESASQIKFTDNALSKVRTVDNVTGQYLQINNGSDKYNMYCMTFESGNDVPYYFTQSSSLGSFYPNEKVTAANFKSGREGIVSVDSAEFYFAIGDVEIDGQTIEFREIADSISLNNLLTLNEYLETEPFNVSDNSNFFYSVQYGLNDSLSAVQTINNNMFINFKVMLVDNNTGELIGEYDDLTFEAENLFNYNNISYQVNTAGIGNREVRLKLSVNNNFSSHYSLSQIYSDDLVLGKSVSREINYTGGEVVTTYELSQNYPNPFNPTTTIKYQLPKPGNVTLKVYDILGAEVATLVEAFQNEGRYEISFDAGRLASGVYIYRLNVNDPSTSSGQGYVSVKKMVLLK